MAIFYNQLGWHPNAEKHFLLGLSGPGDFQIVDDRDGRIVYKDRLVGRKGDLGAYNVGVFSSLREQGSYRIETMGECSRSFSIKPNPHAYLQEQIVSYLRRQRCGDPHGWNGICHLDDAVRSDGLGRWPAHGGWHDACDVRKYTEWMVYCLLGLLELHGQGKGISEPAVEEEVLWGVDYFLRMQHPDGFWVRHVGDYEFHGDQNRWTDGVADGRDDRIVDMGPAAPTAQACVILALAKAATQLRSHGKIASLCQKAVLRGIHWTEANDLWQYAGNMGAAVMACYELHALTGEKIWTEKAEALGKRLLDLQAKSPAGTSGISGFFLSHDEKIQPNLEHDTYGVPGRLRIEFYKTIGHAHWLYLALAKIAEQADGRLKQRCRTALTRWVDGYVLPMTSRSAFSILPYGLHRKENAGQDTLRGLRPIGNLGFRYFMAPKAGGVVSPDPRWSVGINAHLAGSAVALAQVGRVLGDARLAALTQTPLDWILGLNPFGVSTVSGVGHHQVAQFIGPCTPSTPCLSGGVMNGIGGDEDDKPLLIPGDWHHTEYWTPMVGQTLWLTCELEKQYNNPS